MPSGITHILLAKNLQNVLPDGKLKKILQSGRDFFQVGAVGPDLPYAIIAGDDFFFSTQSELADKFHYEKTNELILKAFQKIKTNKGLMIREKRFMFCFYLGFASHIIADGIMHPFVRDMVGNYHDNQTAHRILEMQLDVLLFHHFTFKSNGPINFNNSNMHKELINFDKNKYPETKPVVKSFSKLIKEVYDMNCPPSMIEGWIKGLYRMFDIAEGEHPKIYKVSGFLNNFLFSDYEELKEKYKDLLLLKRPQDRETNFLQKKEIHFFEDCVPRFYSIFIPLAQKCYDYIYLNKGDLTEADIPPIDLDTGRLLASNNLDLIPALWSVA